MSTTRKPAIVFVHGSWHTPAHYAPMTTRLTASGYTVSAAQMPSSGSSGHSNIVAKDIAATRTLIEKHVSAGEDVVVLMHSMGGISGSEAAHGFDRRTMGEGNGKGAVVRLIYLASFLLPVGMSVFKASEGKLDPHTRLNDDGGVTIIDDAHGWLYGDVDPAVTAPIIASLNRQSFDSWKAEPRNPAWLDVPSTFILCEKDQAVPIVYQEMFVEGARKEGAVIETVRLGTSHSPFLSRPDELNEVLCGILEKV